VRQEHYSQLIAALIVTLESALGTAWTEEQEAAWNAFFGVAASVVQSAYNPGQILCKPPCLHLQS
jgi:hemoglobin-like flavoprotein